MLNSYLTDTALFLNDPSNLFYSQATLTNLINRSRRWLAMKTICVRVMVTSIDTAANQETYAISLANAACAAVPGVAFPCGVIGISVQQGNYYIALGRKDFPSFQADERILDGTLQNYPDKFSSFNRGSALVAYMFPVPAAQYQSWWDLVCMPINLAADADPEAIPAPWTEIVPWEAARLALITQARWADATELEDEIAKMLAEASTAEMPFMRPDWYPNSR